MEKQTGFLGLSSLAWVVIGVVALVALIGVIVVMLFGVNIGGALSS